MSQQAALLRAVIAAPDDDAPRLIYADWLDEQGDSERAEFIRLQCALETSAADSAEDAAKIERESELLDRFACLWANDLQPEVRGWTFRRGFVERIETNLQTSRDAIAAVLQKAPIRHIRDTSQMSDLSGVVAALPMFDRLTGLEFWGMYTVSDSQLREILTSPHLQNLKTLII
ncbi:MAG TPA: TIGR02996 domain-containing protein, partial [Pirellulales bacterium]